MYTLHGHARAAGAALGPQGTIPTFKPTSAPPPHRDRGGKSRKKPLVGPLAGAAQILLSLAAAAYGLRLSSDWASSAVLSVAGLCCAAGACTLGALLSRRRSLLPLSLVLSLAALGCTWHCATELDRSLHTDCILLREKVRLERVRVEIAHVRLRSQKLLRSFQTRAAALDRALTGASAAEGKEGGWAHGHMRELWQASEEELARNELGSLASEAALVLEVLQAERTEGGAIHAMEAFILRRLNRHDLNAFRMRVEGLVNPLAGIVHGVDAMIGRGGGLWRRHDYAQAVGALRSGLEGLPAFLQEIEEAFPDDDPPLTRAQLLRLLSAANEDRAQAAAFDPGAFAPGPPSDREPEPFHDRLANAGWVSNVLERLEDPMVYHTVTDFGPWKNGWRTRWQQDLQASAPALDVAAPYLEALQATCSTEARVHFQLLATLGGLLLTLGLGFHAALTPAWEGEGTLVL